MLSLGANASVQPVEAPMAFQSALAGLMLAAELVIHAAYQGATRPARTEINLLRRLGSHLSQEDQKHPSGRCLCQDEDYLAVYGSKYLAQPSCSSFSTPTESRAIACRGRTCSGSSLGA
jgi:hypothetical protein